MKISHAEFCKYTVQQAANLLLTQLDESEDGVSAGCKLYGADDEERLYCLELVIHEMGKDHFEGDG